MNNKFEGYLRKLRNDKQLTLVELSKLTGLSKSYLSQLERGDRGVDGIPSPDILKKLHEPLGISHFDLMVAAGYYTDEDLQQLKAQEDFFNSMSLEEIKEYEEERLKAYVKHENIKQYQEKMHTRIEDFLKDERRSFYIDDHKLTHEEIKMLITLYGGKEKNYPSDEQIQKEYEEIKKTKEENKRMVKDGEAFFIIDPYYIFIIQQEV